MHLGWTILLLGCGGNDSEREWLVEPLDWGSYAAGSGYAFEDPQTTWLAAEHVLPSLWWSIPASNIPLYLWEDVLSGEDVMDVGSCPYLTLQDDMTTWSANCRSQEGYNWSGSVTVQATDDGTWTTQDWTFDLQVSSDREGRVFDKVTLEGRVRYIDGDDEPLTRHVQVDVHMEAPGYWAGAFKPELDAAWSDMNLTGTWEAQSTEKGESWQMEARADLGELGGFSLAGRDFRVEDDCAGEPKGEATLHGANKARLEFEGADACNGCAKLWLDGERAPNACQDG